MQKENPRVPVLDPLGNPLMPTKASRARRWKRQNLITEHFDDLGQYYVQFITMPSGDTIQPITVGVDPGKSYSGIGVQSKNTTLARFHLILPFNRVRERMAKRAELRRSRRGRRINRKVEFKLRNHRQCRFDNRRGNKLAPSIRASRQLEIRVVRELSKIYPISAIYYERVRADVDRTSGRKGAKSGKGFSPVMVGQNWAIEQLNQIAPVEVREGWQHDGNGTSQIRRHLGLIKDKVNKSEAKPETHSVDGVALACNHFVQYQKFHSATEHGARWIGEVTVTTSIFKIVTRFGAIQKGKQFGFFRRQLHVEKPAKGNKRKRKGGTVTPWGLRIGDFVKATKAGETVYGWIGGYTEKAKSVSVYTWDWDRIGKFVISQVKLVRRSNGLCVT